MSARRHRWLSWICGILILLLWVSSHLPWHGAVGVLPVKNATGWTSTYNASQQGAEAYGMKYFFGGSYVLLLAGLWMILPQFRATKLNDAPWGAPIFAAAFGWIVLFRWYPDYQELNRYYRDETSNALHVVGHSGLLIGALSTLLLTVFGLVYAIVHRKRLLPPPPPPPPGVTSSPKIP